MAEKAIVLKHWILRHYIWISVAALMLAVGVAGYFFAIARLSSQLTVTIFSIPISILYALQRQKTEELCLFEKLFTEFNKRYDEMNKELNELREAPEANPISKGEMDLLYRYFNLCAEEFLYFKQEYIYPEVWAAWRSGMEVFRSNVRIRTLWDKELLYGSYYGLGFTHCEQESDATRKTVSTNGTGFACRSNCSEAAPPTAQTKNLQITNLLILLALLLTASIWAEQPSTELDPSVRKEKATSQYELGRRYMLGEGVPKDQSRAEQLFLGAAEKGLAPAQMMIFAILANRGDWTNGLTWLRKAADQNETEAQIWLAESYSHGHGGATNAAEAKALAAKWYRTAAELGDVHAQVQIASLYTRGEGVVRDEREASKWYAKAAEQGAPDAQCALGSRCVQGLGVPKNPAEGVFWLRRAAKQGDSDSQALLAMLLTGGVGVPKDYVEAYMWANLAAASCTNQAMLKVAEQDLDALELRMNEQQIAEAQRLSTAFIPHKQGGVPQKAATSSLAFHEKRLMKSGTAFFITTNGYLITCFHVIEGAEEVEVKANGAEYTAKIIRCDPANDIALLKAEGTFRALPLVPSRDVKLGESIFTVGFPNIQIQGFSPKLTTGEISSLAGVQDDSRAFQISVAIQPGNSGGPLVDMFGNVVGVVEAKLSELAILKSTGSLAQNVNYATKSSYVLALLESVPASSNYLKAPHTDKEPRFDDLVASTEDAVGLVLVYSEEPSAVRR